MRRNNISDMWARECYKEGISGFVNGIVLSPLTFCGAVEEFYSSISKNWNNKTREKYDSDYSNVIIPNIPEHNELIISSYTLEICEETIKNIKEKGYIASEGRKDYSESQINHYRYLIYIVISYASLYGYCKDILWGTKFAFTVERNQLEVISKTQIKKSLSIENEKNLMESIMEDPKESGKKVAILLMDALGVRDAEACGLDFGDIYELPHYKGVYIAEIKQTTIPNTCILQSSGKTWNSGRRIPVPSKVARFILERKRSVEEYIEKNNLNIDINRVPAAFDDSLYGDEVNIKKRLGAKTVTETARELFKEIGIDSETLASLEIEMEEKNIELEISEKNVTAYLLRRNFATHLKILGLESADIQYLLGHCIEDPYINRADYTESKLYELSKQMSKRPLLNEKEPEIENMELFSSKSFSGDKLLRIRLDSSKTNIVIYAKEKYDYICLKRISESEDVIVDCYEKYKPNNFHRSIDIIKKYMQDYQKIVI